MLLRVSLLIDRTQQWYLKMALPCKSTFGHSTPATRTTLATPSHPFLYLAQHGLFLYYYMYIYIQYINIPTPPVTGKTALFRALAV